MSMSEKNVKGNEDVKQEMNDIIWNAANSKEETGSKEEVNTGSENQEDPKNETVARNESDVDSNVNGEPKGEEDDVLTSQAEKKKRNVIKFGDKEWATKIPESERFNGETVVSFRPGTLNKVGKFVDYGKKEGIIWVNMFKKNSFTEFMSRQWPIQIAECDIVEHNGVLNEKYIKTENSYKLKDQAETQNESAAEQS